MRAFSISSFLATAILAGSAVAQTKLKISKPASTVIRVWIKP